MAQLELALDFSDQDIEIVDPEALESDLAASEGELSGLLAEGRARERSAEALRIVLVGPANAGKSSLFNALIGRDEAIVADRRGTTRDWLESPFQLLGRPCVLVDTAGLDFSAGPVDEAAHQMRSSELLRADLIVEVMDGREPVDPSWSEALLPAEFKVSRLRVRTRADLIEKHNAGTAKDDFRSSDAQGSRVDAGGFSESLLIDARHPDEGSSGLSVAMAGRLGLEPTEDSRGPSSSMLRSEAVAGLGARQRDLLQRCRDAVRRARAARAEMLGYELVAADLHEALDVLRELSGEDYDDQVLDRIMRDFCIGK